MGHEISPRLRVGIVGLQPGQSWANRAHLPALRALSDRFVVAGVANRTRASAEAAAAAFGIPHAFTDAAELAASPEIDVVTVTVRVPQHMEVLRVVLETGKPVYCEWPLGNGLEEAEEIAVLAEKHGVLAVAGCQARVAPEILHLRRLLADGWAGTVLSSSLRGTGGTWGAEIPDMASSAYLLDRANGATMLTIPVGHVLAAVRDVLGDVSELSARLATRRPTVRVAATGAMTPMTAPDQVLVHALLDGAVPFSLHYRGGSAPFPGLVWDIHGTAGDLRLTAASGHAQLEELTLEGAAAGDKEMTRLLPPATEWPGDAMAGNVARMYARLAADLQHGTRTAPTFADAVRLHRVVDAIERADLTGARIMPDAANRALPLDDPATADARPASR